MLDATGPCGRSTRRDIWQMAEYALVEGFSAPGTEDGGREVQNGKSRIMCVGPKQFAWLPLFLDLSCSWNRSYRFLLMANPRQRRKARSSSYRPVSHSKSAKRKLKKTPRTGQRLCLCYLPQLTYQSISYSRSKGITGSMA